MRITLVSPFDPDPVALSHGAGQVGGVERVFSQISRSLAARGHHVTMLCSSTGPSERSHESGVHIVREHRRAVLLRTPIAALTKNIPGDADIVHVPATYPLTTPFVLMRAHRLKIPSVLDFHFEPRPEGALGATAANLYRSLGPRTYPLAHTILVRSHAYGKSARSLQSVPTHRWQTVPNGVDPLRFRPRGRNKTGDYLLFVGRLVPYKGVEVLLRALAVLRPKLPLFIVGEGPLRERLETIAKRFALDVVFLGRVADQALPDLYRRAALTLLPSVNHQEAFGISILESMACGTPVVASDLPGVAELARHGGLVAPPGQATALAMRIQQALEPGALPRGKALSRPIHNLFSWQAVTDRLESVYEQIHPHRRRR